MNKSPGALWNLIFGFVLFIVVLMFKSGYFHGSQNTKFQRIIDFDKVLFPDINKPTLIRTADKLAFNVCLICAVLTSSSGVLTYLDPNVPNIGFLFMLIGFLGSWIIRYGFIYFNK